LTKGIDFCALISAVSRGMPNPTANLPAPFDRILRLGMIPEVAKNLKSKLWQLRFDVEPSVSDIDERRGQSHFLACQANRMASKCDDYGKSSFI
jgi:hypothetical protein